MPYGAGQAGNVEDRQAENGAGRIGNFSAHPQTRVSSRATWVDGAVVRGVGGPGGVWGYR